MTPRHEQYDALLAVAELVEIGALPADDLAYYIGHALNLHAEDVETDQVLSALMHQMRTCGSNKEQIIRQMLTYVS